MKKLLAFVLALGLAVSTSVTAFAEDATTTETNDSTKSTEIAVNGSYQAATPAGSSISVDVMWEDMSFTYTGESQGAWDPKTHSYGADIPAHWAWSNATEEKTAPNITLTNHSDTGVKATFAFVPEVDGLNGTFTGVGDTTLTADNALTLATAVETDPDNAPSAATAFSVDGSGIDSNKQLGNITVTVAKDGATGGDADVTDVSDSEALRSAVNENKASIRVTNDFTVRSPIYVSNYNGTLDLSSHTLTRDNDADSEILSISSAMTVKNGGFADTPSYDYTSRTASLLLISPNGNVTLEKCKIESDEVVPLYINAGTALLKDCTITSAKIAANGTLIFSGETTITDTENGINKEDGSTVTCLAGTYNFDPTAYVDKTAYTVTDNNGTWTVAEGATGGDTSPEAQVGDKDALNAAVDGKKETITLTADIALTSALCLTGDYTGTIDLNNHKLSNNGGGVIESLNQATLSIENGTLESTSSTTNALNVGFGTTVTVDDCTIQSDKAPALLVAGDAALHNCTIQSTNHTFALRFANKGHLTLSGITNITGSSVATNDTDGSTNNSLFESGDASSLTCLAGTYNFDPTPYVNTGTYEIIRNTEKSTWTVTTGESTGEETPTTPGITTFDELKAAVDSSTTGSEVITLGGNIDAGKSMLTIPEGKEVTIDLGGHTLTGAGYCVINNNGTVTIKNGTIVGTNSSATIENERSLTADGLTVNNTNGPVIEAKNTEKTELKNCSLSSANSSVISLYACGATIVDCALTSSSDSKTAIRYNYSGNPATQMITIGGNTTVDHYIVVSEESTCDIKVQDGCSFDPALHYDKNTNTLTGGNGGIWTLKYGAEAPTDSE